MSAVIFDCDGVLIGSEPLSVAGLGRTLREAGARTSDADIFARMSGRPVAEIVSIAAHEDGVDATPLLPDDRARLRARCDSDLRAIPGIHAALAAMPDVPRAVASSSTPARLEHALRLTGLWDDFAPHVYSVPPSRAANRRPICCFTRQAVWASRPPPASWSRTVPQESPPRARPGCASSPLPVAASRPPPVWPSGCPRWRPM